MRKPVKPVETKFLIVKEHSIIWVKEIFDEDLEELFFDSSFINTRFSNKLNSKGFFESFIDIWILDLPESVFNYVFSVNLEH